VLAHVRFQILSVDHAVGDALVDLDAGDVLDDVGQANPDDTIVVVLPEMVPGRWWEHLLHNQTALRLKATLLFHPGVIVANVPYHLAR
jgi:hypothetical protein